MPRGLAALRTIGRRMGDIARFEARRTEMRCPARARKAYSTLPRPGSSVPDHTNRPFSPVSAPDNCLPEAASSTTTDANPIGEPFAASSTRPARTAVFC